MFVGGARLGVWGVVLVVCEWFVLLSCVLLSCACACDLLICLPLPMGVTVGACPLRPPQAQMQFARRAVELLAPRHSTQRWRGTAPAREAPRLGARCASVLARARERAAARPGKKRNTNKGSRVDPKSASDGDYE